MISLLCYRWHGGSGFGLTLSEVRALPMGGVGGFRWWWDRLGALHREESERLRSR